MAKPLTPILQQGTGQPYLAIFDTMGMPIRNTLTGIPIGAYITRWSFTYDEEQENLATITIEVGNPDTVDITSLQENSIILLQWGYVYATGEFLSSPVRVIRVRDFDCIFDDTGTHITLKCMDGTSGLRYFPPYTFSELPEYSLSTALDQGYYKGIGVVIEEFKFNGPSNQ